MEKIKVGIVGCGALAQSQLLPALKENCDLCDIVAFCDNNLENAYAAAASFGSNDSAVYADYTEMILNSQMDVVQIAVPNALHAPIAVAAFEAGKHVVCEKPMADNEQNAQKMMHAWRKSGKLFTVGYQNRFRPEVQALKAACAQGELGEIYFAKAYAVRRKAVPTWGVFANKALQGGGPLIDIGTHALDLALWLMDNYEPATVTGSVFCKLGTSNDAVDGNLFGAWDTEKLEVEDSAFGYIRMKNGAVILLESAWALNVAESREASVTLCGTRSGAELRSGISFPENELILNQSFHGLLTEQHISKTKTIGSTKGPKVLETRNWLAAIQNGTQPLTNPEQAFTVTRIINAIYQSAQMGKEIQF